MAQAGVKGYIVRATSPDGREGRYFVVSTNNPADATEKVRNWANADKTIAGWHIEDAVLPYHIF